MTTEFRYDTVILDVGGTLLGFHEREPFQEFLAHAGLPASDEDAHQFHRRLISVILARRDGAQGLGADEEGLYAWWRGNFAQTWPGRPDLADEMARWLFAGRFDRLFPDAQPALEALRGLGMPLAVLSNFGAHLRDVLRRFHLLDYFRFVVVSAEVGLAKPDPRIFDLAAEKAGVPRRRLLYVGDHLGDDIEGARNAGLDAALIDRRDRLPEAPCPRISSLLDLVRYVRPPTRPAPAIILHMDGFDPTLVPGVAPLLYDLRGRGYRLGLVAGGAHSIVDESLFDAIVVGNQASRDRPDPTPYRTVAARLALSPEECLAVENAPQGVRSARAAGMACVALETDLPAQRLSAVADQVFPDVKALRAWLLSRWQAEA